MQEEQKSWLIINFIYVLETFKHSNDQKIIQYLDLNYLLETSFKGLAFIISLFNQKYFVCYLIWLNYPIEYAKFVLFLLQVSYINFCGWLEADVFNQTLENAIFRLIRLSKYRRCLQVLPSTTVSRLQPRFTGRLSANSCPKL